MRVLLSCATPEYTGPAELMIDDAVTLRDAGHDVTLAIDTRRSGSLRERVAAAGLEIDESLDLCRLARPGAIARDVAHLRASLRAGRYDTLYARFSHDHHIALMAAVGLDRRRFRVIRSCELLINVSSSVARGLAFSRTDYFVVPSEEHKRVLIANHGVLESRVVLLPGRVDAARFSPGESTLRAELGISANAPVVGIVSRMKPERRHVDLVAAFARALQEVPDANLVIVGRGEGKRSVREAVRNAGVAAQTRFAGYRTGDALVDAYRALDVKAWLASGNDGTCRAVLEAMACGCAVLGGRSGAIAEAVVDGVTGKLCDPGSPAETGTALATMLKDRSLAHRMGKAGRERVLEEFTPSRRASVLRALCERVWAGPA